MGSQMWFGTEDRMRWIDTPSSGADMSPQSASASGVLLGGGGWVDQGFGSHQNYVFAWPNSSSVRMARLMQSYREGTYGRGLIHFIDPLTFKTNILPKHVADPSLALDAEMPSLIRSRVIPMTAARTMNATRNDLPLRSVVYNLADGAVGFPGYQDSVFIPVPPGYELRIGAFYTRTGSGGVFAAPVDIAGTAGTPIRLSELANDAETIATDIIAPGQLGVRLWVGKDATGAATVTLAAMVARLTHVMTPDPTALYGPWTGGQGHSGCRFVGNPTYIAYNGVRGGQIGYSATFKETGSWEY